MKKLREKTIKKYLNGESPKEIYRSLGKGKTWFFKWLKRYRLDGVKWAAEHSRRPHQSSKQIDQETEQMVIATRKKLENKLYAQIGASNIEWQLRQEGREPPSILQMDNLLCSKGSNRYSHSFGIIIRLCLYLGIQPVFIPIREPWRNGIIEHFQFNFDQRFFRSQAFTDFDELCQKAKEFEQFHNQNHRYSTLED